MGEDEKKLLIDIHREVGVTQEQVKNVADKVDTHINKSSEEFQKINELDAEQNIILQQHKQSLDIHIEGVNTLKDLYIAHRKESKEELDLLREDLNLKHTETSARIEALEQPYDFIKYIGKVFAWIVPIVSVLAGIAKIFEVW
jgi:hypothetical protein